MDEYPTLGGALSAITYYEESVEVLSKLPTEDLELVRTLSVSLNKVGDLLYYDGASNLQEVIMLVHWMFTESKGTLRCGLPQVIDLATSLAKVADVDSNLGNTKCGSRGF